MADEYLDINKPVESDRIYCREDDAVVEDAILSSSKSRCYYGLRRFGKSSFLRKIDRHCREKAHLAEKVKAFYFDIDKFTSELVKLSDAERFAKTFPGHTILLLDDLRLLESQNDSRRIEREFFAGLKALKEFKRVRFIISEPTNLGEYLSGDPGPDGKRPKYGKRFAELFADDIESTRYRLNKLSRQETIRILCGDITQTAPVELDEAYLMKAYEEFGGNPWFLSHARHALDNDPDLARNFEDLQEAVALSTGRSADKLASIIGSLRQDERFVLRVLHAVDRSASDAAKDMRGKKYWRGTPDVQRVSVRLEALGLIDAPEGYPQRIVAQSVSQHIDGLVTDGKKPPMDQRYRDVREEWVKFINMQHPDHSNRGELIIHQLSDILFGLEAGGGDNQSTTLTRYREYLEHIPQKERPHFIVICGNLITGHESSDERSDLLRNAAGELETIGDLLQDLREAPKKETSKEKAKRLIVLPGVFDLEWKKGSTRHAECLTAWNRHVGRHFSTTSGSVLRFSDTPLGEIVFLPFDSVSIDAIKDRLGDQAVDDMMDIRRALQLKCREPMMEWLRRPDLNPNGDREVRAHFIDHTLRYTVDTQLTDKEGKEAVESTSFKWYAAKQGDPTGRHVRYSEVGFVSGNDLKMINESFDTALKIGLMHHHPYQQNPSPVSEFYESVQLRRRLAENEVQVLLHGHSQSACMRTEIIATRTNASTESSGSGRRLRLIASGVFCQDASYEVNVEQCTDSGDWLNAEITPVKPAFNCLRIKANEEKDDEFDASLEVYEMTDEGGAEAFALNGAIGQFRLPERD